MKDLNMMEQVLHMKTIKTKFMTLIKEFLFGRTATPVCQVKLGFKTTHPKNRPDEWSWMKEYNVGMLSDRKIVHLN